MAVDGIGMRPPIGPTFGRIVPERPAPPDRPSPPTPPGASAVPFAGQLRSAMNTGTAAGTPAAPAPGTAAAAAPTAAGAPTTAPVPASTDGAAAATAGPAPAAAGPAARGSYPNLSGDLDATPEILGKLQALAAKRGEKFTVTSGLRTYEEQLRLWNNRANNPYPVARPGTSNHKDGRAVDVTIGGRPIQDVISAAELRTAGLRPLAGDAVHVELPS